MKAGRSTSFSATGNEVSEHIDHRVDVVVSLEPVELEELHVRYNEMETEDADHRRKRTDVFLDLPAFLGLFYFSFKRTKIYWLQRF